MRHRALTGILAGATGVLLALGLIFAFGVYGDSRWMGIFLLVSGLAGASLSLEARRAPRAQREREPTRAAEAATPAAPQWYPLICGLIFFVVGTLAQDAVVGVMGGLAGLAFGWLATAPIEKRRR